jgi:sec-independent protein translocase protein TatB
MFDIGWGELLVIGVVALVAIGPKELPTVLRTLGQWMGKLRRMASEFQGQFQEAMREAEMGDLKKQVDEMAAQAQSYANFDPVSDVRKELDSTQQQIESAMADKPPAETSSPPGEGAVPSPVAASPELQSPAVNALPAPAGTEPAAAPSAGIDAAASAPAPAPNEPASAGAGSDKPDAGGKPA